VWLVLCVCVCVCVCGYWCSCGGARRARVDQSLFIMSNLGSSNNERDHSICSYSVRIRSV